VLTWLKNLVTSSRKARLPRRVLPLLRARYDAAVTTNDNRRHWAGADELSANAANSAEVRRILRNRSRYEIANNSYARGIVLTLANDVIGTGPRLQMFTGDAKANRRIERDFAFWSRAVGLAEKLRTLRMARAEDGEGFIILTSNPAIPTPMKLDLRLVEADQVATPDLSVLKRNAVDGIVFDSAGNPVEYHILKRHPGDMAAAYPYGLDYDRVPAESVIHWFRVDRPGQARGIPDIMPALPLFAQLRRYTLAVIAAAETAADFAGILYTDSPASGEADAAEPFEPIELEQRALLTMPGGWKMGQIHAEQPATTYGEFKREILNEIARCLNMPFKKGVQEAGFWSTTQFRPALTAGCPIFSARSRHSAPPPGRSTNRRPCWACSGGIFRDCFVSSRRNRVLNLIDGRVGCRLKPRSGNPRYHRTVSDSSPRDPVGHQCTPDACGRETAMRNRAAWRALPTANGIGN